MRLIDADALMYAVDGNPLTTDSLKEYVRSTVKAQPTVDAVPVIRCKDCKYYEDDIGDCIGFGDTYVAEEEYCSRARRRDK